ncbi:unnamed protein product [Dovyalis caffra]|uniref:Protein kinase domain-containing protein n=1 Tax=Dovyalis caffra TaxID=77055 RepID=A0AAV1STC4_9ROSI|nr:unnamed protein product [Dovyalis caffra]
MRLTDVSGTPYWMAPEVIHDPDTGYSFQADIWCFGITAVQLAHGRPPFSRLPPSKSLIMKIKKRFGLSDYHEEKHKKDFKKKKFSKDFTDMVASCLDQDHSKRPYPDRLLEYSFFKNCKGLDFLFKKVFDALPNVEETFKETKGLHEGTSGQITGGVDVEEGEVNDSVGPSVETRRIGSWKFNEGEFELDPEFLTESKDDAVVKMVRFGDETIIPDTSIGFSESSGGPGDLEGLVGDHTGANTSGIEGIVEGFNKETVLEGLVGDHTGANTSAIEGIVDGFNRETALEGLVALKRSSDEQIRQVASVIVQLGGEADGEEQMVQRIENLMEELDLEKEKNFQLEKELENICTVISGSYNDSSAAADID